MHSLVVLRLPDAMMLMVSWLWKMLLFVQFSSQEPSSSKLIFVRLMLPEADILEIQQKLAGCTRRSVSPFSVPLQHQ